MRPLPWSHSSKEDFKNCPKAFYEKRVAKSVVDPPNEAGDWGNYVHKEFEKWLNARFSDRDPPLPADCEQYRPYLQAIAARPGLMYVECKYAITRGLQPCDFFAEDVWCRAILDVIHVKDDKAWVQDHKTGKRKHDTRQLKLCALMVFIHHPQVNTVYTAYNWLVDGATDREKYTRDQEAELWGEFLPDLMAYKQAFHTMTFNPKPSGLCNGWCPVTSCEFWKPKRRQ